MIHDMYYYSVSVLKKAQDQGKPKWALSSKEKRALRYLTAMNRNFTVVEGPVE